MWKLGTIAGFVAFAAACTVGPGSNPDGQAGTHPCEGYRTDALWFDDASTGWLGCGTDAVGVGLFATTDGGATWSEPATSPAGILETFRATHAHRAADGILYIAGTSTVGSDRVLALDTSASPYTVTTEFASQSQTWNSFHAGTFYKNSDGFSVAESLTGADLAFKSGPSADYQDGYEWWTEGSSVQVLDMALYDDKFYGCGSNIIQPPQAFLPAEASSTKFSMTPVELASFRGEMWSIDVDAGGIVVGGVDQDRDVGMIFTTTDPDSMSSGHSLDVSSLLGDSPTWVRGVCRDGDTVVAVGEFSVGTDGFILESSNGGETWNNVTPNELPSVQRCMFLGDGGYVVAGGQGYIALR